MTNAFSLGAAALVAAALALPTSHAAAVAVDPPTPPQPQPSRRVAEQCVLNISKVQPCGGASCYRCSRIGGATLKTTQGTPFCVVKGEASQVQPCGGKSCYIPKGFEDGCAQAGGFISGNTSPPPGGPICTLPGSATQFGPCPGLGNSGGTCTIEKGFEDTCTGTFKGFIDGYTGPSDSGPSCTVAGDLSWFVPCNGSASGCTFSSSEFIEACTKIGGVHTADQNSLPVCVVAKKVALFDPCSPDPRDGCSYSTSEFAQACSTLGGALAGTTGTPQCIVTA